MPLALFDLDHTLIQADSPSLWFRYLIDRGQLTAADIEPKLASYTRHYHAGTLDYTDYIRFESFPLREKSLTVLEQELQEFQRDYVARHISNKARELVESHRARNHELVLITATNNYIARAAATELRIPNLLATELEIIDGRYTGNYTGIRCFQSGKIEKLKNWHGYQEGALQDAWFYSDSINDLPLLQSVGNPVLVNADQPLSKIGRENGWPHLDLRPG